MSRGRLYHGTMAAIFGIFAFDPAWWARFGVGVVLSDKSPALWLSIGVRLILSRSYVEMPKIAFC